MTPEERDFLQQRWQEISEELKDFAAGERRPLYVDPAERFQQLRDELDRIESELREDEEKRRLREDARDGPPGGLTA